MISIVIPVIDQHEITEECIQHIQKNTVNSHELIIIDNGSDIPYQNAIVNGENRGLPKSLEQGYAESTSDILLFMHNDVLIHEHGWDVRIQEAFDLDPKLGIAGFFGGRGVSQDGGRIHPESNMLGLKWGSPWNHHGRRQIGIAPAAVLDGLALIFRTSMITSDGFPQDLPPHHWYDRILPLYYIDKGWRCATIGIGFDHGSGFTSSQAKYHISAKKWCEEHGINTTNYDGEIYNTGLKLFQDMWAKRLPLYVDEQYNYSWNH